MRRNLHAGKRQSGGLNLKILTDDELDEIHLATLEVLEETGLLFDDDEALEVLDGGGAIIDKKNNIAKFPPLCGGRCYPLGTFKTSPGRTQSQKRLRYGEQPGRVYQFWRRGFY